MNRLIAFLVVSALIPSLLICLNSTRTMAGVFVTPTLSSKRLPNTTYKNYLPLILSDLVLPSPPITTTSRYVIQSSRSPAMFYSRGCSQGIAGDNMIVVLDFGDPEYNTLSQTFGTTLPAHRELFVSTNEIENLAESFLKGYFDCSNPWGYVVVGIGTNNCGHGSDLRDTMCVPGSANVSYEHGQAWGAACS